MESILETWHGDQPAEIACSSWKHLSLQSYILRSLDDRLGMMHAVESRMPFLDHHLWETVRQSIPTASHFSATLEKTHLRQSFSHLLPPETLSRPKHPFMAPSLLPTLEICQDQILEFIPANHRQSCSQWWPKEPHPAKEALLCFTLGLSQLETCW